MGIVLGRTVLAVFIALRTVIGFVWRVLVCEPFFKAYCTSYGRNLHTGEYLHWVQGQGELVVGDNVMVDGKCGFSFAARFVEKPRLSIGNHTTIGHGSSFTVGKSIQIGDECRIATNVRMFDSPGHPLDPEERRKGMPVSADGVRPIVVERNVWIGADSVIFPGVSVGEGSIIATCSVVTTNVEPFTMVAGNPARRIYKLKVPPREA